MIRPPTYYPPALVTAVAEARERGMSRKAIAALHGLTEMQVKSVLDKRGRRPPAKKLTPELAAWAVELRSNGLTFAEVYKAIGFDREGVREVLGKAAITPNRKTHQRSAFSATEAECRRLNELDRQYMRLQAASGWASTSSLAGGFI